MCNAYNEENNKIIFKEEFNMLNKEFEKVPESLVAVVDTLCEMHKRMILFDYLGNKEQVEFYKRRIEFYERDLKSELKR
jgi:hypothetical protein